MNKPTINEIYYNKWQHLITIRKATIYIPIILIAVIFVISFVIYNTDNKELQNILNLSTQYFFSFFYLVSLGLAVYLEKTRNELLNITKKASLHLIARAISEAANGDKARVAFITRELFKSLNEYLRHKIFRLGKKQYSQSQILYTNPSSIKEVNILKYLQVTNQLGLLKVQYQGLQNNLKRKTKNDYITIQNFILSLAQNIEEFSPSTKRFDYSDTLMKIPSIIASASVAVYYILKILQAFVLD